MTRSGDVSRLRIGNQTLWFVIGISLALFAIDTVCVLTDVTDSIDRAVLEWFVGLRSPRLDDAFGYIADTGGIGRMQTILLASLFFYYLRYRRVIVALILSAVIAQGMRLALSALIGRPRPDFGDIASLPAGLGSNGNPSFPSGHAFGTMVTYGFLALWFWLGGSRIVPAVLAIWILLVWISRLYSGVHYPTDVFASACLGVAVIAATQLILQYFEDRKAPVES